MDIQLIYNFIGQAVCHQIPARSIEIGGELLPVCARCTGIYVAIVISALFLFFSGGIKGGRPPRATEMILPCLFFLPLMIDGVASYSGLWQTNNLIRIITGVLCCWSFPMFAVLVLNYDVYGENTRAIFDGAKQELKVIGLCLAVALTIYFQMPAYHIFATMIVMGILLMFTHFFALVIKLIWSRIPMVKLYAVSIPLGGGIVCFISLLVERYLSF